jgi:YesN/AraC family two-component response regulator
MGKKSKLELAKYSGNLSILVVDDDEMIREIVSELLSGFFKILDTAINGKDAYDKHKTNGYDIILSDITMPVMDGIELGTMIKEENPKQIFIIISAHGDSEYLLALTKIGVDGFIQKPVDRSLFDMLSKVSKCIYCDKNDIGVS